MPNWILKSAIQRAISWLPKSHRWNAFLQKRISKGYLASQSTFEAKLGLCERHLAHYRKFCPQPAKEFSTLELGTGSWPIVAIGLYLCGAKETWTYDLVPLVDPETLRHTLAQFDKVIRDDSIKTFLPDACPDRIENLTRVAALPAHKSPATIMEQLQIHLRVGDSRHTNLPPHSVDLVFSTVVFEHIPAAVLRGLLAEFRRVISPDGVMSHYIGLADQYASVDRSITPFNFLRYTSRQWRWLNNPIISQSRLRMPEYRDLFRQCGYILTHEENILGQPDDLRSVPLASEFRHHSLEDLLVLFSWLVAKPVAMGVKQESHAT